MENQNTVVKDRNVQIITDLNGNKIVVINDIIFKGKRNVCWKEVEKYLKRYVDEIFKVALTEDIIYIGTDLPDEYTNSNYTHRLKGVSAKAKANAAQGLPEMIEIASDKQYEENKKSKHSRNAKLGWYRYESRFALPVFNDSGEVQRYNVFHVLMLMRHSRDNRMYLYDIMEIKKETSKLFESNHLTQ